MNKITCTIMLLMVCLISINALANNHNKILETLLTQNQGKAEINFPLKKPIHLSSQINIDYILLNHHTIAGNRYLPGNNDNFNLNTASFFIDSDNNIFRSHINLHKQTTATTTSPILQDATAPFIEEASVSFTKKIGNQSVFSKIGKQYILFGEYELYHMSPSLNQLLSQTRQLALTMGAVNSYGMHAAIYLLPNRINYYQQSGIAAGLKVAVIQSIGEINYKFYLNYLSNLANVNYINSSLTNYHASRHIPGYAAGMNLDYRAWNLTSSWMWSGKQFPENDINYKQRGAKPWAADIYLSYKLVNFGYEAILVFGQQQTGEAVNVGATPSDHFIRQGMPRSRQVFKYSTRVSDHVNLAYEALYDHDYSVRLGGTGKKSLTNIFRVALSVY